MDDLAHTRLDAGDLPRTGGQRPHLTVMADLATLRGQPGCGPGELDDGVLVPAETVRRLGCDAIVSTIVTGEGGEPLGVGRTRRTIPTPMRRALLARDRHCRFEDCDRPGRFCDAHHIVPWQDGGETKLSSLVLICRAHHTRLHEGGWRVVMVDGVLRPVLDRAPP